MRKNIQAFGVLGIIPLISGLLTGISNIALIVLRNNELSSFQTVSLTTSFILGAIIGSFLGGFLTDKFKRKPLLIVSGLLIIIINLMLFLTDSFALIISQRIVTGFAIGLSLIIIETHLTELLSPKHRGKFLILFYSLPTIGILLGYLFNYYITKSDISLESINYSTLNLPIAILPIFFLGFIGKVNFSRQRENERPVKLKELFQAQLRFVIYTMFIFALVAGFGNYSMINYYYARELTTNGLHLLPTLVSIFASILSLVLIDRIGRKKILEIGGIGLILISILLLIAVNLTKEMIPVLVILHLYLFVYVFSFGSVMNILILEYLPTRIRGRGLLVYHLITWIPNYLATSFFLRFSENVVVNSTIIIAIMLIVNLIGYIFARKKLIETRGIELKDIDNQIITRPNTRS